MELLLHEGATAMETAIACAVRRRYAAAETLHGHGLSVEAMNEHREPSHPVSAPGRSPGGGSPTETLMQVVGEAIRGTLYKGDLKPGSGR